MTRVVGVDPSLTATGVATPNALLTVKHPRLRGAERLVALRDAILHRIGRADLIVLHVHPYDVVALAAANLPGVRPPVVLENYADHAFWLGVGGADRVCGRR